MERVLCISSGFCIQAFKQTDEGREELRYLFSGARTFLSAATSERRRADSWPGFTKFISADRKVRAPRFAPAFTDRIPEKSENQGNPRPTAETLTCQARSLTV